MTTTTSARIALPPAYSEVMEDHQAIERALAPRPGERALCIASAGDNAFHLALRGAVVAAVDVSADQIALCRLKAASIATLDDAGWHALAGVAAASPEQRRDALERVRAAIPALPERAPALDAAVAAEGLVGCGALSAFVAPLRTAFTTLVGEHELLQLLTSPDARERTRIWQSRVDTAPVRELLDAALCEATIADAFIPARAWPRMAEPRFGTHYFAVLRRLVLAQDPRANPYLHRLWLGRFAGALPPYLERENRPRLAALASRLTWHEADVAGWLEQQPPASLDLANLSNVLDWCDDAAHDRLWTAMHRTLKSGARLFLRSFLVERTVLHDTAADFELDRAASERAAREDRVGYSSRYELWRRR